MNKEELESIDNQEPKSAMMILSFILETKRNELKSKLLADKYTSKHDMGYLECLCHTLNHIYQFGLNDEKSQIMQAFDHSQVGVETSIEYYQSIYGKYKIDK